MHFVGLFLSSLLKMHGPKNKMYIPVTHFCNFWCTRLSLQEDLLHDTKNVPATSTDIVGFRNISKTE